MKNAFVLLLGVVLLVPRSTQARELTKLEKSAIVHAMHETLKDPDSMRLKWMPFIENSKSVYCSLVNARNSYGGYTGFVPYLAYLNHGTNGLFAYIVGIGTDEEDSSSSHAIIKVCAENGYDLR
jgi:hypothetical protein